MFKTLNYQCLHKDAIKFLLVFLVMIMAVNLSNATASENIAEEGYYGLVTAIKNDQIEIDGEIYTLPNTVLAMKENDTGSLSPTLIKTGDSVLFSEDKNVITKIEVLNYSIDLQ